MCDSIVATAPHTAGPFTLFGKNSDRHAGECQPFVQIPAAHHQPGSTVRCTHLAIPQVAETYRVMGHSPWWVWGFEHGVNEHAVAIGNQTVFTREPVETGPGLIGMDLVRLALERGRDAREALEIIATLVESHGQGGSALGPGEAGYHNSFLIADAHHAWILETSGRRWAARRVLRGSLTNHLTLGADWEIGSRDLERHAREHGLWRQAERLDVAAAYRHPQIPGHLSEGRLRRSRELLDAPSLDDGAFRRILRDHGPERALPPDDLPPEAEARYSLCMHGEPVGTTTASLITTLPHDGSRFWPAWIGFGSPCAGTYLPVYVEAQIPDVLSRGGEQAAKDSAWWIFHQLDLLAERDWGTHLPVIQEAWARFEVWLEGERVRTEREANSERNRGEEDRALERLSLFVRRGVDAALEQAEGLIQTLS